MNKAQQFWDKQAKRFDDTQKNFNPASQEIIVRTKEYLNANDYVLDYGCATGIRTLELADGIKHIHGLDYSAEMINEAIKKKKGGNATNVTFSQGTIFDDDLKKASFNKVIAYSIIHLLEESEKVVQRIHELLKPGGLLIAETPCFKERMDIKTRLEFTTYFFLKQLGMFPLHLNMYKFYDIEQLLNRHSFKIVKAEKIFLNGMTISFIVAEKK